MNTHSVRFVFCGFLAAIVLVASQGCVSSPRPGADGRPPTVRPQYQKDGLTIPVTTPVVVQKRAPTPTPSLKKRALRTNVALGTQTIDFQVAWPTGLTGSQTLPVKCYEAVLVEDSNTFLVSNETSALNVFNGSGSTTITLSSSSPTASVSVNLDNVSGNFFYLGTGKTVTSGGVTYDFKGGMILTKP